MGQAVFRGYDQATLEAQFTLDTVADLEALFARRASAAAAARAAYPCRLAIPYGDGPNETVDVFPAARKGAPAPVVVFIHGGFWRFLDAATFHFLAAGFVPAGAALVLVDYALIPAVDLATIVDQCRRAVAWTHRNAAMLGGDPGRLFVAGSSAGGHLTALLMDRTWPPALGLPAEAVAGGIAISGLYELEPVRLSAHNAELGWTVEEAARWSPQRRLPRAAGPLLLTVGGDETPEFLRQTADYAAAWTATGLVGAIRVEPGANHITILLDHLADRASELNRAVQAHIGLA